jgi:Uma2 family endonuclease
MAQRRYNEEYFSSRGVPITEDAFERLISVETPYRYEMINGQLYDMTGSTPEHGVLAGNVFSLLHGQVSKCLPCRVYQDQYVVIPNKPPVVPDVVLTCDLADWDKKRRLKPFRIQAPLIVVEVLSPSTEKYDRGEKFARYQSCPTLEVYILVSQDEQYVEVYRRATDRQQERFSKDQTIKLEQHDLELPLSEIYEGVL